MISLEYLRVYLERNNVLLTWEANYGAIFAQQRALLYSFAAARRVFCVCMCFWHRGSNWLRVFCVHAAFRVRCIMGAQRTALNWQHKEKDFSPLHWSPLVCPIQNSWLAPPPAIKLQSLCIKTQIHCVPSAPRLFSHTTMTFYFARACAGGKRRLHKNIHKTKRVFAFCGCSAHNATCLRFAPE